MCEREAGVHEKWCAQRKTAAAAAARLLPCGLCENREHSWWCPEYEHSYMPWAYLMAEMSAVEVLIAEREREPAPPPVFTAEYIAEMKANARRASEQHKAMLEAQAREEMAALEALYAVRSAAERGRLAAQLKREWVLINSLPANFHRSE